MKEKELLNGFDKAKDKYKKAKSIANPEYLMSKKALYCPKCGYYFFLNPMGEYRCPKCGNEDTIDLRVSLEPMEKDSFLKKVKDKVLEFQKESEK